MLICDKRPTTAVTDLETLASNLRSIRDFLGPQTKCLAVVKANAYGHGAVECARRLSREGIEWFGVALPEEGVELRRAGIEEPVLVLGGFWHGQEQMILDNGLTAVVFDAEHAELLDAASATRRITANYHVKIDTGMGRLGVRHDRAGKLAETLKRYSNIRLDGLMSHFPAADDVKHREFTELQIERFERAVEDFRRVGFDPTYLDIANSPGTFGFPSSRLGMVRLGGVLYGLTGDVLPPEAAAPNVRPVLSLVSQIAHIKTIPKGEAIGYGRTFETKRESRIAVIPIGYADGYVRSISNNGRVIVGDGFAPIVGRISMDWTLIDVTDMAGAEPGAEVVLIGSAGEKQIRAEELAHRSGTISYEITCGISDRVNREYV